MDYYSSFKSFHNHTTFLGLTYNTSALMADIEKEARKGSAYATMTLEPGSALFLYTDGVPEAMNEEKEVLASIHADVDDFVKDAEQFDDLTMLSLKYKG